ncbi:MAG: hypothetical protein ACQKBT_06320 [Puniceicoccales bacterium]
MRPGTLSLRPGEWGERSLRIAILGAGEYWATLDQPSPVGEGTVAPAEATASLQQILRNRLQEEVAAYRSLLGKGATAVYNLPCGGPVIYAGSRDTLSALREEYGSSHWTFRFLLLTRGGPPQESIDCDLPVAVHNTEDRSLISHTTGKRASTRFQRILRGESLELWEAQTHFLRPDQIRLHAAEVGLSIAGESLYGTHEPISRPDLPGNRKPGGRGFVLYPAPAVHLAELIAPSLSESAFTSEPPKSFIKWIRANLPQEKDLQSVLNSLS